MIALWDTPVVDVLTFSPGTSLANYGRGLSNVIDNSIGRYPNAMFQLAGATASGGVNANPYIGITVLYAPNGTDFPSPPGATPADTGMPQTTAVIGLGNSTFTQGHSSNFLILPFKMMILMGNNLGTDMPAGLVATLHRWGESVV